MIKKVLLTIFVLIILAIGGYLVYSQNKNSDITINNQNQNSSSTNNTNNSENNKPKGNITIDFPKDRELVAGTLVVKGQARVFESQLNVRISANGKKLEEIPVMAKAQDVGQYGPYAAKFSLAKYKLKAGQEIEIMSFDYSAKDGSEIDQVYSKVIYDPVKGLTPISFNDLSVELWYPANWKPDNGYKIGDVADRYKGDDGFFQVAAIGSPLLTLDEVAKNEAYHKLKPYGSNPQIVKETVNGKEARFVFPDTDQFPEMKNQAAFITKYPSSITVDNTKYNYFVLYADKDHIRQLANTVEFLYQTVDVYFSNNGFDPEVSCNKTFPIKREILKTNTPAQAAIEELLKGLTSDDKAGGYYTSINPGVKIQKLTIANSTAKIDFNETLQQGVGGSCKVAAIRSQITQTLKQFPTVKNVIISINGDSEMILQP